MSEQTQSSFRDLQTRIEGFRRVKRLFLAGKGLLMTVTALVGLAVLAFLIDMLFGLPPVGRMMLWTVFFTALAVGVIGFVLYPLFKRFSDEALALEIGQKFGQIGDRLVDAMQLWQTLQSNRYQYSTALSEVSIQETAQLVRQYDFAETIARRPLWLVGRGLLAGLVLFGLLAVLFPGRFSQTAMRFRYPAAETLSNERIGFTVMPGTVKMLEGSLLRIDIQTSGPELSSLQLLTKAAGEDWQTENLTAQTPRQFDLTFPSLRKSFQYYARSGQWQSETYTITITERPIVTEMQLRFEYPAYTHLPPVTREINDGEISALKGTTVDVIAKSNNPLDQAAIVFDDNSRVQFSIRNQTQAEGRFRVMRNGNYRLELIDKDGVGNPNPLIYNIKMIEDEAPLVRILQPGQDADLGQEMKVDMTFAGVDDYGFSRLDVRYYTNRDSTVKTERITVFKDRATDFMQDYTWSVAPLDLLPEDVVTYWAELYDNDTVSGPKMGRSPSYTLRLPSLNELYAEVDEQQSTQIESLDDILDEGRELKETLEEISREMQKNPQVNWEKQKELEKTLEKQKELQRNVENLAESLDKTMENLEKNAEANMQIMEKMAQIQEMMQQVATPEMMQAMQKMQEAMQSLSPEEVQKAMEQMKGTQEEMLQRLDQTLAMLKQLQKEQRMNAAVKKAQELEKRQEALNQEMKDMLETPRPNPQQQEQLAKEQEAIQKDLAQLQKEMEQLKDMMKKDEPEVAEQLEQAQKELNEQQTEKDMQEMAQMMRQNQPSGQQCNSKSSKIKKALTQMAQSMQKAQKQMQSEMKKELAAEMERETQDLINLSKEQEALKDEMQAGANASMPVDPDEMADQQMSLSKSLNKLSDQVFDTAKKSMSVKPEMMRKLGEAMQQMENSMQQIQGNSMQQASSSCQNAMAALNDAAKQMMSASSQSNSSSSGSSGSSMQQKMQQMSQQQQGVNSQTQSMFDQMGQNGISMEGRQQMARLAGEQRQIQKGMEELAQEVKNRNDLLGRLDDMAKEAEEVVKDMEARHVDRRTLERQQKILSRMLDSQKSMREREYSRKRESKTAGNIRRAGPHELPADLLERKRSLQDDLLRSLREGMPVEYEGLIKAYFQSLSKDKAVN